MTNFVEVIKACEEAEGAGTKAAIKEALSKADMDAQWLIAAAMNPYMVFGVRAYDNPTVYADKDGDIHHFCDLLVALVDREFTGNAARAAVTSTLSFYTEHTASYLARIFDKDLKAGFSAKTVNKIFPDLVPVFDVMLADKCEDTEDFEKYVKFPCIAEFKLDGQRSTVFVKRVDTIGNDDDYSIIHYSRSGLEQFHLKGIFNKELIIIRQALGYDFVLDGEVYGADFTETMNAKKSGNDEAKASLKFYAFFIMSTDEWYNKNPQGTMLDTRDYIMTLVEIHELKKITSVIGRIVNDYADMMNYCNSAIDDFGVEGLILKQMNAVYQFDRTFIWTKLKRFYDVDMQVIGFYRGRINTRLANTVGGMILAGYTESGELVATACGSGFSDADREHIFENLDKYLGSTSVIKYQDITRSKGKVASLRFPVHQYGLRGDKRVEVPEEEAQTILQVIMKGRTPI